MNADALFALVGKGGKHQVTLTVAREVQSAAAPEGGPPPTSKDSNGEVKLDLDVDIADLLVQEPKISASFPRRGCPPPEALAQVPELQQVILDFVVRQPAAPVQKTGSQIIPEEGASPSQLSAGAPASSPGAPEPQPYSPGSPRPLLPAGLAKMWNPMVVRPIAAKSLPDAPATPQQLDELCDKVRDAALTKSSYRHLSCGVSCTVVLSYS